jgi:transposase-like protein
MGPRLAAPLVLAPLDRATITRWVRGRTTPQRTVLRGRIVLMLADGLSGREVARQLGIARHTVDLWRTRFREEGPESLLRDRPGRGRRARLRPEQPIACERPSAADISRPHRHAPAPHDPLTNSEQDPAT